MKKFITFLFLVIFAHISFAQSFPTQEEIQQALIDGPERKVVELKDRILNIQSSVDSTSLDYQICNIYLLALSGKLEDRSSLKKASEELYLFLNNGGRAQLKEYGNIDQLQMQVTLSLMTYYTDEGNYQEAQKFGEECLRYAKGLDNYDYYTALLHYANLQNKLGNNAAAYKNIKLCYNKFNNTERLPGDAARSLINATYFNILRDLSISAASKGDTKRVEKYFKEALRIESDYPKTNTSLYFDSDFLIAVVESLPYKMSSDEVSRLLTDVVEAKRKSYLEAAKKMNVADDAISDNDFYASCFLGFAQDAMDQNKTRSAEEFINLAAKLCEYSDVSNTVKEYTWDYLAFFLARDKGEYLNAILTFEKVIPIRRENDSPDLMATYSNFLNTVVRATYCNRYFYSNTIGSIDKQDEADFIPIVSPQETHAILVEWKNLSEEIIKIHGKSYFNTLLVDFRLPINQRVFIPYSLPDTKLMMAHNFIRESNYESAFATIQELISEESLKDEKIQEIIWRIDNNLYLHTGYNESDSFLMHVRDASFVKNNPELISWVDCERERIKDWLGYAIGVAHGLAETGNVDEAMQEYDIIIKQIQGQEKRDSLYLEVQLARATDLFFNGDDKKALEYVDEINDLAKKQNPNNDLLQSNTLWLMGECLRKAGRFSEALSHCEENLNLTRNTKIDSDGHHLRDAMLQYGDILLDLKKYNQAERAYIEYLNALNSIFSSHYSYEYDLAVSSLAQIYGEKLQNAITKKNGRLCMDIYSGALALFKSYPNSSSGYSIFFNPLSETIKDIIAIIPKESVIPFCEQIIETDTIINAEKEIDPIKWHASVIDCMAFYCHENCYYKEAIYFYDKTISYINVNSSYNWENRLAELYSLRAITKEAYGEWVSSIEDRRSAFLSSMDSSGSYTNTTLDYFGSLKMSVDIALETSLHYVNAMYNDRYHPHLDYEDNLSILNIWKDCLDNVETKFGRDYLRTLHSYVNDSNNESYLKKYGVKRQDTAAEKLSYKSECILIESLLNISNNQLAKFTENYAKFLDGITSFDDNEDLKQLRYHLVLQLADALSHAGFSDWSFGLLEHYYQYLVAEAQNDFELAEKITTRIGFMAWRMMDVQRLIEATTHADFVAKEENHSAIRWLFYDINELISQLVILSRIQHYTNNDRAIKTLDYAKELVDSDTRLSNGAAVTSSTLSLLYNDLAFVSNDPELSVEYYEKVLKNEQVFDPTTRINLASMYMKVGKHPQADSLLSEVYQFSQNEYLEPRWKASLYSALTKNAIDMMDYNKAREYSKERLSIQITDYLKASQSLTSQGRNNYWDHHYANSLVDASSIDLACGDNGSNAYNAALFQKSILIRQKQSIKDNILQSSDEELRKAFIQYNSEIRSHSISATDTEAYCMYLYSMHPEFVGSFRIPQWHEVQSQLGKNELALEFALANDVETGVAYYVAILLGRSYNAPRIIRLCKKEDFITMATKDRDNTGFSIGLYQDRTVLYHLIWAPIERYLRGVKTIYYSPFEFLNNVSIETASKQSKGKTVGSLYRLIRVSSTAELLPQDNGQYENAILFGGLDYNASLDNVNTPDRDDTLSDSDNYIRLRGSMGGSWARRPYMKDEVEGIQQLLSGKNISTTLYTAGQGTEEVFKSLSGAAPNILHLATHGFYYTVEEADQYQYFNLIQTSSYNSGVRSGVVLSGANHAWNGERIPRGREDGILTADEISGMDLTGTSILALSACQTALGDIASDGVYGMQRSFKIAGVDTIIMSLWQVDDEATYVMMERFYQELSNGKEKHVAFKIAQTAIQAWAEKRVSELREELINLPSEVQDKRRAQYGGRLYPEYYWAAFIMLD